VKIAGRGGAVSFKSKLGIRKFDIDVTLLGTSEAGLAQSRRDIAKWLFTDVEKPLIFSDEPSVTYQAKISGDTNWNQLPNMGESKISFLAVDPHGYGAIKTATISSNPQTINNTGTASAFPIITFTPTAADLNGFVIANTTTGKTFTLTGTFTRNKAYQIDMGKSSVIDVASGARLMPQVRIDSDFWSLQTGNNSISYTAASATTVSLAYTERFY
jgi:predicted phage tail component-like protein